jgi:hypothetical protein
MMTNYEIAKAIAQEATITRNIVTPRSRSLRYLFYRIARPLLKANYKLFKFRRPETPWTAQAAIRIFDSILNNNMTGFEYGSGNSTLYFARRLKALTSVEHHAGWFELVKGKLAKYGLTNVTYKLIQPSAPKLATYDFYVKYGLDESEFTIMKEYHDYFSFVSQFPDNHFDFIMVDGRARVECCLNAIPKLKAGGIFVLDNSDRRRYEPVFKVLHGWTKVHTTTGLFDTTFWFKP